MVKTFQIEHEKQKASEMANEKKNCATSVETKTNKWLVLGHDSLPKEVTVRTE